MFDPRRAAPREPRPTVVGNARLHCTIGGPRREKREESRRNSSRTAREKAFLAGPLQVAKQRQLPLFSVRRAAADQRDGGPSNFFLPNQSWWYDVARATDEANELAEKESTLHRWDRVSESERKREIAYAKGDPTADPLFDWRDPCFDPL